METKANGKGLIGEFNETQVARRSNGWKQYGKDPGLEVGGGVSTTRTA